MQDSTPMILLVGQVARDQKGREAFQEVEYRDMFKPPFTNGRRKLPRLPTFRR
jgi:thiamine pyrophosphate-dependent acetolactate synthase large subunit-like protein